MIDHRDVWVALGLALLAGCASSPAAPDASETRGVHSLPVVPEPASLSIGAFLARVDTQVEMWCELTLIASTEEQRAQCRGLQLNLARECAPRIGELIVELEGGPPLNRRRAAAGLGFTFKPEAQGPLLGALHDPSDEVVSNALLGLAVLGMPDTPLESVARLVRTHPDSFLRSNAAWAMRTIVEAGARDPVAGEAARMALVDPEPNVRVQSALVLGILADPGSTEALGDLLYDRTRLVAAAGARSLALIGRADASQKGRCARALVRAWERVDPQTRRSVHRALIRLRQADLGDEVGDWVEWAGNMP